MLRSWNSEVLETLNKLKADEAALVTRRQALIAEAIEQAKAAYPEVADAGAFDVAISDVERALRWWADPLAEARPKLILGAFLVAAWVCRPPELPQAPVFAQAA
jgi:hypothetical protein